MSTPESTDPQSRIDIRREKARRAPSESYLRRRHELQIAAAELMRRKGFREMTLGDLAHEVVADRASIYYYTAGKEQLLADMVLAALEDKVATFAESPNAERRSPSACAPA